MYCVQARASTFIVGVLFVNGVAVDVVPPGCPLFAVRSALTGNISDTGGRESNECMWITHIGI